MRYNPEHKNEAHSKILSAVGRGFRRQGFCGIGVDGLAKEAGVTSGAFYGHFSSKSDAFAAAAVAGLVELRQAIGELRETAGQVWLESFVDFYLSFKRTCELGESCALQSLTLDVARADIETKVAYEAELLKVVEAVALGLPKGTLAVRRKIAWAILSLLSGGVTLARSAHDRRVSDTISGSTKAAIFALAATL